MTEKLGAAAQVARGLVEALTFDDVLLVPRHSQVLPSAVNISSRVTRRIRLTGSRRHCSARRPGRWRRSREVSATPDLPIGVRGSRLPGFGPMALSRWT